MIIKVALAIALSLVLFSCNYEDDGIRTKTQRYQSAGMTYEVVVISTLNGQTRQVVNVTLDSLFVSRLMHKSNFEFEAIPDDENKPILIIPYTDEASNFRSHSLNDSAFSVVK